jgi:hypothetical protein
MAITAIVQTTLARYRAGLTLGELATLLDQPSTLVDRTLANLADAGDVVELDGLYTAAEAAA